MALTPMMRQYVEIKSQHPDAILFYRLGDFYEMFFEDAKTASKELEITLTGKDCGLSERAPMCGVPFHSVDSYIAKLIEKGYKVAICEQMSDPALSKGLVEREVVRVITPGTIIEEGMLDQRRNNYILSLYLDRDKVGAAFCDVSTGEFRAYQFAHGTEHLPNEVGRIMPREIIVNDAMLLMSRAVAFPVAPQPYSAEAFGKEAARQSLDAQFGRAAVDREGISEMPHALCASGALLSYLKDTQMNALSHISALERYQAEQYMLMDGSARRNLELTETLRARSKRGSLLWHMDRTVTSMGGRMLRAWVEQPLFNRALIEARLCAVEYLKTELMRAEELREALKSVHDIERLLSRVAYGKANARDALSLALSLEMIPRVQSALSGCEDPMIVRILRTLTPEPELVSKVLNAISPDAPISLREGGIIKPGYNQQLDTLREAARDGKQWLAALEAQEREATGIKNLKISYNKVFGYYIEVTKSNYDLVPYRYTRKQTLANAERYITQELKEIEQTVVGAEENAEKLEYQLFIEVREAIAAQIGSIQAAARGLKELDALQSLAQIAVEYGYVRPQINENGVYKIQNGRHPVVERSLGAEAFVPNDALLNGDERVMIITGPNMAGKSTYMRQIALIALMAHIGSFVPADSADISVTDRILTRIGASDDLYGGQSTFMVEMTEMAGILKSATPKSLVILDEIGRGTSTFDGLSIAWSVVEHISGEQCGARTLFATHYHELSELEGRLPGVVNYCITVKELGEDILFLRKIVRGGADKSFGISVARLAGLPQPVIGRAREIMARLEEADINQTSIGKNILVEETAKDRQATLFDYGALDLAREITQMDVLAMSPIDALNVLFRLKERAKKI